MEYAEAMERVLQSGGNLTLNSSTHDFMKRLAKTARSGGGHVTFVGAFSYEIMIELAKLGGKHVTLDIAKYPARE